MVIHLDFDLCLKSLCFLCLSLPNRMRLLWIRDILVNQPEMSSRRLRRRLLPTSDNHGVQTYGLPGSVFIVPVSLSSSLVLHDLVCYVRLEYQYSIKVCACVCVSE